MIISITLSTLIIVFLIALLLGIVMGVSLARPN
jgi:hypothetical protein